MPQEIDGIIKRLREAIEDSGYSYKHLERLTGIPSSNIQRYAIGGSRKIPVDAVQTIARAVGVSPEYIMGWEDDPRDEFTETLELLKNRPEMKILFDTAKTAKKEDVERAAKILEALKGE